MFLKEAIYHRTGSKWSYLYKGNEIHIVLRVRKDDVKEAYVFGGDVYNQPDKWDMHKMELQYKGDLFEYWIAKIDTTKYKKRFKYFFRLESNFGEYVSYSETELFVGKEKDTWTKINTGTGSFVGQTTFIFPYINPIDKMGGPSWVNDVTWYQIFPERFANGNKENDRHDVIEWGSVEGKELTNDHYFGGDIKGITNSLDYLKDLGIGGLYLNPIFKANTAHKYDTEDYMKIDPEFGTIEEFKEMVHEAHKRGIKIMLDGVFNHSGSKWAPWQDVLKNKQNSKYYDWFYVNDPDKIREGISWDDMEEEYPFEAFAYAGDMPRLKWEHPDVREYLLNVGRYWAELGIDAWRLDVAYEPSHNFWQEFKKEIRKINPEIYMLGEIWTNSESWMDGNEFDSVMNYPFQDVVLRYFAYKNMDMEEFKGKLLEISHMYAKPIAESIFNLLDSHDTMRLLNFANGNKKLSKLAHTFLMLQTGTPSIYYGSEFIMAGGNDPDCRRCMIWNEDKRDNDYLKFMKTLIHSRNNNEEWRKGEVSFPESNGLVVSKKILNKETLFIFNRDDESKEITIPSRYLNKNAINVITGEKTLIKSKFKVPAENLLILKI